MMSELKGIGDGESAGDPYSQLCFISGWTSGITLASAFFGIHSMAAGVGQVMSFEAWHQSSDVRDSGYLLKSFAETQDALQLHILQEELFTKSSSDE